MNQRWKMVNPQENGHYAYIEYQEDRYKYPYSIVVCRDYGSGSYFADGISTAALTLNLAKAVATRFLGYKTKWEEEKSETKSQ